MMTMAANLNKKLLLLFIEYKVNLHFAFRR